MEANEIDLLMDKDPLELSSKDINEIIAYQRRARANFDAGIKPTKPSGPKVSLKGIIAKLKPEVPEGQKFIRRI